MKFLLIAEHVREIHAVSHYCVGGPYRPAKGCLLVSISHITTPNEYTSAFSLYLRIELDEV
jgi:hypothetical protein